MGKQIGKTAVSSSSGTEPFTQGESDRVDSQDGHTMLKTQFELWEIECAAQPVSNLGSNHEEPPLHVETGAVALDS